MKITINKGSHKGSGLSFCTQCKMKDLTPCVIPCVLQ